MTQPPEDTPALWLRQKDPARPEKPPVWATRLIPYYTPCGRSHQRPDTLPDYNPAEEIID